jgi:3-oxoadipate enol-lactonase
MATMTVNGARLFYTDTGAGPETLIFSHGLLWSHRMFAYQVAFFSQKYRVIAYDHRGQGQSEVTAEGYDMDTLTADAVALIRALCPGQRVHFAGLSMGGFVGMRLAARHPELLRSLTLLDTSAQAEPSENLPRYRLLAKAVRWLGTWAVAGQVMKIMFASAFLTDVSRKKEREHWKKQLLNNQKVGMLLAIEGVLSRAGVEEEIENITLPTLVLVGTHDVATIPAKAQFIQSKIKGAQLGYLQNAGHTSTVEEPEQVNAQMETFLENCRPKI